MVIQAVLFVAVFAVIMYAMAYLISEGTKNLVEHTSLNEYAIQAIEGFLTLVSVTLSGIASYTLVYVG